MGSRDWDSFWFLIIVGLHFDQGASYALVLIGDLLWPDDAL